MSWRPDPIDVHQDRLTLSTAMMVHDVVAWLKWRGYRGAPAITPGSGVNGGIVFGKKNEPLFLAEAGDVLVWDGTKISIEE